MITPTIIPFLNTSSGGSAGRGTFIFAMVVYGVVILFGIFVATETFGKGCVSKHLFIDKNKDYVIPLPYSMRFIASEKSYIIVKNDAYLSPQYMAYQYMGGFNFWSDIQDATTF